MNRLASDTTVIQSAVTENVSIMSRYTLQLIISVGIMFWISPRLTAVLLSVIPIIVIGAVYYGRKLKDLKKKYQDSLAQASSTAEETISNIRTVRAFSNEMKMSDIYDSDVNDSYKFGRIVAALNGGFMGVVSILIYFACCVILWYGGFLVYQGSISAGLLISLMFYTLTLAMCFVFISNVYGEFMQAVGASIRMFELMDRIPEIHNGTITKDVFQGGMHDIIMTSLPLLLNLEIEFRKVEFAYPSRMEQLVLKGISIKINPGEMVALVGPSGGGKSTIVNLIEHFYGVSMGEILIDGVDVKELDPKWFRKHIGIVSQEPVLFSSSIKENITFGKDDATQEEIEEVAQQANAHQFILSFSEGYDTKVGERGVRLSGGQKQRIAIARALLLNPDILLLDEATSALDAESEHLVQEAIDRAMKGRTVLVIAHRLSTVRNADKVIVINDGDVAEEGTHDELLQLNGVYKKLILRQLASGEAIEINREN
jgi:ABC-type multidrug transport system fused ATPase/permease subunit